MITNAITVTDNRSTRLVQATWRSNYSEASSIVDHKLARFVVFFFLVKAINLSIKLSFPIPEAYWAKISNGFMLLIIIYMMRSIRIVIQRSSLVALITETFMLFLVFVSYLMGTSSSLLFSNAFQILAVCIPLGIYVYSIWDKKVLLECLQKSSYLFTIILSYTLFIGIGVSNGNIYSMSASYALMPVVLVQFNAYFNTDNKLSLIAAIIGSLAILFFGARGPLVSILLFLIIKHPFGIIKRGNGLIKFTLLCGVVICLIVYWSDLSDLILRFLARNHIYSRTMEKIFSGGVDDLLDSDGRNLLFKYYYSLASEKPLLGWGIYGGWIGAGSGPHNMMLENLLAFGYFFGGLLCIIFILLWVWAIYMSIHSSNDGGLLLVFAACVVRLFVYSGDALVTPEWYVFLFLLLSGAQHRISCDKGD